MLRFNIVKQFLSTYRVPVPSTLAIQPDEFDYDSENDLESLSPALYNAVASEANPRCRMQIARSRDGSSGNVPLQYRAVVLHETHARLRGLASSDALIITRFVLADADKALLEILGRDQGGVRILNTRLGGLEVFWNSDLAQAFERRAAVYSRMNIRFDDDDIELEHLVVPDLPSESAPVIRGWFNSRHGAKLTSSLLQGNMGILRTHRGRPVTLPDPVVRVAAAKEAHNKEPRTTDRI